MSPEPIELTPTVILSQLAGVIPAEVLGNAIIVGSLAAAYQLFAGQESSQVRTKDVDCVLTPHFSAVENGQAVATKLIEAGWSHRAEGMFNNPGQAGTPDDELPLVRLHPPGDRSWFLELLAEPQSEAQTGRGWARISLADGDYGIASFPFLRIATFEAVMTPHGIKVARHEMMALANLLEHRAFGADIIQGSGFRGRPQLRRNKDLGRVLAIAALSVQDSLESWPAEWLRSMQACMPRTWPAIATTAGAGLRKLLASDADLAEAADICASGLLSRRRRTVEELKATGERLLALAVSELEEDGRRHGG